MFEGKMPLIQNYLPVEMISIKLLVLNVSHPTHGYGGIQFEVCLIR